MDKLNTNLYEKYKLNFHDEKFRILCISDLHGVVNFDRRILSDFHRMLDASKPDFVFVLGDMVWNDADESAENMHAFCDPFFGILEEREIPWAYTFGNHDSNTERPTFDRREVYKSFEHCLNKDCPEDVYGDSNFVLPVFSEKGDDIVFNIWSVDTHDTLGRYCAEHNIPFETKWDKECARLPTLMGDCGNYDTLRFSQLMWYYNSSLELEKYAGHKIPGLMGMHICLPEFNNITRNPAYCYFDGIARESCGSTPINSGMFACILDRGDVKTIVAGHDHINDYTGKYYGINLMYDGGFNYDGYCDDDIRGGRIIDINENDPWNVESFMLKVQDIGE